ncbi:MAG: ribosomal protein S18-alanine N-acetyltransferase [Methylophilaceae bacterium]|nr:MAG: ribosomal protein S18-alanine N-acetyltransferase [Methylophilaceae bacterium]
MSAVLKPNYAFRLMQEVDLDAVMHIEPTIYSHPWTRGNFNDSLKSRHDAWVLTQQDEVVGYALMMIVLDEAHLLNISVAKPHQQQGLGRMLLTHMIDRARALDTLNMFLEVRASNIAAITLYEDVGFVEMSIRRGYYPAKKGREDAVLMGLVL